MRWTVCQDRGTVAHYHKQRSKLCPLVPHRGFKPAACFDIWLATFHIMEMLYDTPFPEMPQTDRTSQKADRNAGIIARYEAGETGASIAQDLGISEQRVNQIVRKLRS
jgi:hypothetical protein